MSGLEIAAAALGIVNIVLLVRRSIWNYAFGIATVTLSARVLYGERLYSDALLQAFFLVLNIYGWASWRRAGRAGGIAVERLGWHGRAAWLGVAGLASVAWGTVMARMTDAALPYVDGAVAMFSIAAQVMLARRLIENWLVWIGVDVVAVGVYLAKHLYAFAILYVAMLLLCVAGLREWRGAERAGVAA